MWKQRLGEGDYISIPGTETRDRAPTPGFHTELLICPLPRQCKLVSDLFQRVGFAGWMPEIKSIN